MTDPALQSQPLVPALEYGCVRECTARRILIETRYGDLRGSRAVSCLIAPRPGDRVLLSIDGDGECFVLAVLTREAPGADIDLSGPSTIRVREGGLTLAADETIAAVSRSLSLTAEDGRAELDTADISARRVKARVKRLHLVAKTVEHCVGRLTQHLINACRYVREHDESQAGSARHLVEETLTVQAKNSIHQAEELAKIDAGQIHLG